MVRDVEKCFMHALIKNIYFKNTTFTSNSQSNTISVVTDIFSETMAVLFIKAHERAHIL